MDVNEYMSKSLEHQTKQTALLEAILDGINSINESGVAVVNQVSIALPEGTDLKAVGNVVHAQPADKVEKKAEPKPAETAKAETAKAETAKAESKPAEQAPKDEKPAESKQKKVTVDDARAALKKFAAIEGNDAAMDLLTSLKAKSVSDLAEQGPDALQSLIDKCEGKGE
jgi:hypothetical protein